MDLKALLASANKVTKDNSPVINTGLSIATFLALCLALFRKNKA